MPNKYRKRDRAKMLTINAWVTEDEYKVLARKADREGFKVGEKSGMHRMVTSYLRAMVDWENELHPAPTLIHFSKFSAEELAVPIGGS